MKALTVKEAIETLKTLNPEAVLQYIDGYGEPMVITHLESWEDDDVVDISLSPK